MKHVMKFSITVSFFDNSQSNLSFLSLFVCLFIYLFIYLFVCSFCLTLERPRGGGGGHMEHPIGFSDLKFEAFKQSK